MKSKDARVEGLSKGVEGLFRKYNVNYIKGKGKLISPNEVSIKLNEGSETKLSASNIIIATGSEVTTLPNVNIDEKLIVSSTGALSLKEVPKHLVVIGGGVIGLELGSVWRRLGSKVTVIEYTNRIAAGADGEVAKEFQRILERQGMNFQLERKVTKAVVKEDGKGVQLTTESAKGGNLENMEADVVLVSTGRRPYTEGLGLKEIGVKISPRGTIEVDNSFKTNFPSIRAIGDVIRGPMLAHKSEEEGVAVIEDIVFPGTAHVNYDAIPSVIYTWPEVAWVGKTEEELKSAGKKFRAGKFPFKANSRARTISKKYKLLYSDCYRRYRWFCEDIGRCRD